MVFGEMVDCVPILPAAQVLHLDRRAFVIGGLIRLALPPKWITALPADELYVLGALLMVIGDRDPGRGGRRHVDRGGLAPRCRRNERPEHDVRADPGMVQVLGRLVLVAGVLSVAGLSGLLASIFARETVFLLGLVVPAVSVMGVVLIRSDACERRPIDWRILGGGLAFGAAVLALALGRVRFGQEIIFVVSMTVVCVMLVLVTRELDRQTRRTILFAAIIIFAFRATPSVGDGYFWFTLDVLKFDEAFYGMLRQTGAIVGLVVLWLFSKQITEYSVAKTLFWIAVAGTLLTLPDIGLYYGLAQWTEQNFGFGARTIAILDVAAGSPFAQLSMIPLLTLIAFYAPAGQRATWFALMASLMNLALVAGQLQTKYLNHALTVGRGDYQELGLLLITVTVLGLVVPVAAIVAFGRRV